MKKLLLLLLLISSCVFAQTTGTVTGTIHDPTGQLFVNGTFKAEFVPTPNVPGPYLIHGTTDFTRTFSGSMDNTGTFSVVLTLNTVILPANSGWRFTVCPYMSNQCSSTGIVQISGDQDISNLINAQVLTLKVNVANFSLAFAYQDSEVFGQSPGNYYYNVTIPCFRFWDGFAWNCIGGGGGGNITIQHNGATVGTEPIANLIDDIRNIWTVADNAGATRVDITAKPTVTIQHNEALVATQPIIDFKDTGTVTFTTTNDPGNNRVTVTATSSGGGGTNATYQHNNSVVATEPQLNFLDNANLGGGVFTVTDDPGNTRVNVAVTTQVPIAQPPPPFPVPGSQYVAWAYPTRCQFSGSTQNLAARQCGTTSGYLERNFSCPLCDTNIGLTWDQFVMPTLPNDAVIQAIYGVVVIKRTLSPTGFNSIMNISCNASSFAGGGSSSAEFGEFGSISLGTTTPVVTGGSCNLNSASNINFAMDDTMQVYLVAMAIYYTTASPPSTYTIPLIVPPFGGQIQTLFGGATCSTAGQCTSTYSWPTVWPDANYVPTCTGVSCVGAPGSHCSLSIDSFTASTITVRIGRIDGGNAQFSNMSCIGVHQ